MKFSERTSNQSTFGCCARMWPKWTVRRPTPTPRSGRFQRLPTARRPRWKYGSRSEKGKRPLRPPPVRTTRSSSYRPLQPLLPLQELLSVLSSMCSALTGTAQPPLPLQEFLPAQPVVARLAAAHALALVLALAVVLGRGRGAAALALARVLAGAAPLPVLQPPLPLQALWPLQTFLRRPSPRSCRRRLLVGAEGLASRPAMPATTAPITFVNSLRSIRISLVFSRPTPGTKPPVPRPPGT